MINYLVSIIIPTYNRAHLIQETLDSIVAQTYQNWECIIVDDGSTDNTKEVLNYYLEDKRFQYHQRPIDKIKGANACRNYGFELSRGEFVKWFDSDDIMHPDFLKIQVNCLVENIELDFCICLADSFNKVLLEKKIFKANRIPGFDKLTAYLVKNHYFFTASPLWKKTFLEDKDLFDEILTDSQETDFHFRMLTFDVKYVYTDDVLFSIRRGHDSITQNKHNEIDSAVSRLLFFIKAFKIVQCNEVDDKDNLLQYILNRQLGLLYFLKNHRMNSVVVKYYPLVLKNVLRIDFSLLKKVKTYFGMFLLFFFNNGYVFLKCTKNNIIEVIEN